MLPYWILFAYFAAGAALRSSPKAGEQLRTNQYLLFGALLTTIMIGTRYEVGGDWRPYRDIFAALEHASLERALGRGDPGYQFLNWAVQGWNGDIWVVNLICGSLFMWGLCRLALKQPAPLLAIVVGVPYLIIVVAMGYTRQSAAIGILMAGLASLSQGASIVRFSLYVAVAALFHRTAVLVLPLVIFAGERNRLLNVIAGGAAFVLFFDLFLAETTDQFLKGYIETRYSSQGAWIRVTLNLVPALLLLMNRGKFGFTQQEERVWRYIALTACALPIFLITTPSSTAVDRMALYLMPLQIVIMSRAYLLFRNIKFGIVVVVAYALVIQVTWLNFATHASHWVPYQSSLFGEPVSHRGTDGQLKRR